MTPMGREVDFLPGGDYAFCVVVPMARNKAQMLFYHWNQVELDQDDGRIHPPAVKANVGNRELLLLAKYLLNAAGHKAAADINVPDQDWSLAGNQHKGEDNGS